MGLEKIAETILLISLVYLSITMFICLIRVILGPRFTDRILMINVINVKAIILISILAFYLEQYYLIDIAIIYAAISFLSTIVLSKILAYDYSKKDSDK